jgi:hypothetical protein
MTVTTSKPALSLREELTRNRNPDVGPPFKTFDFTGDGSLTDFALPKGWKPLSTYDAGAKLKELTGAGFWTAATDGFVWTVTFGTAPTNLNVLLIDAWRVE